jgi:signal transduction histidine kinase
LLVSRSLTMRAAAINSVLAAAAAGASGRRARVDEGPIEFRVLSRNLNAMLDTLEHRLIEMRLASDRMAHDLRTPLTRIAARLSTIDASDDPTARDAASRARGEIDTVVATLNALLDLREIETESRLTYHRLRLDLAIRDAIEIYEAQAADVHGVTIEAELSEMEIDGSQPLIVRAVANLIDNALHATPRGSTIAVRAALIGDRARIEIRDCGPGFPADLATNLERGAVLKSGWSGNGLGLTIVHAIARRHSGSITFKRYNETTVATLDIANSWRNFDNHTTR